MATSQQWLLIVNTVRVVHFIYFIDAGSFSFPLKLRSVSASLNGRQPFGRPTQRLFKEDAVSKFLSLEKSYTQEMKLLVSGWSGFQVCLTLWVYLKATKGRNKHGELMVIVCQYMCVFVLGGAEDH